MVDVAHYNSWLRTKQPPVEPMVITHNLIVCHSEETKLVDHDKEPSRHTRCNGPRRFGSVPRSEERAYREYGSDERRRRSPKASRHSGEAHLWSVASLLLGHIVPRCSLVAPRPDHKSGPPNGPGYVVTDPKSFTSGPEEICVFKGPFH